MKTQLDKSFPIHVLILIALVFISGCQVIESIFKAGMGVGIFLVFLVLGLIVFIVMKLFGGKK